MSDGKANGSDSGSGSGSDAPGITFGKWLKQTRQQRGIGTAQFAELIGCSTITLLKIEAGERRPSRQIAELLAEHLRVPPDEWELFITFARLGRSTSAAPAAPATPAGAAASRAPWR